MRFHNVLSNKSYLPGKVGYSIFVGVFGILLIVLFLTTFLHSFEVAKFIPWIIGINAAISGYSLLDKTRERIKYKRASSAACGMLTVLISYIILALMFFFLIGESIFAKWDLILFLIIGVFCSQLGAILAIKHLKIKG